MLRELCAGAWELADFGISDVQRAVGVIQKYSDQRIGIADASNVVLADRDHTGTIATLAQWEVAVRMKLKAAAEQLRARLGSAAIQCGPAPPQ